MDDAVTNEQLREALRQALALLQAWDDDANNIQLDVAAFLRRHHRAVADVER